MGKVKQKIWFGRLADGSHVDHFDQRRHLIHQRQPGAPLVETLDRPRMSGILYRYDSQIQ